MCFLYMVIGGAVKKKDRNRERCAVVKGQRENNHTS